MKHIVYQTSGTCSQQIDLDIDDENREECAVPGGLQRKPAGSISPC